MVLTEYQSSANIEAWQKRVDQRKFIEQLTEKLSKIVLNGNAVSNQGAAEVVDKQWAKRIQLKLAGEKTYYRTLFGANKKFAAIWYVSQGKIFVELVEQVEKIPR